MSKCLSKFSVDAGLNRYHTLFESLRDAVFVINAGTGMIVDANQKAQDLTGRSLNEIKLLHHTQLHPPEEFEKGGLKCELENAVHNPEGGSVKMHILHKGGRRIAVEMNVNGSINIGGTKLLIGVFRREGDYEHPNYTG